MNIELDKQQDGGFNCPPSTEPFPDDDGFNDDKYCLNEDDLADFYGADIYAMMTA